MKKLSVIVPVYNTKKYLEQCVNSIISQTYSDMEIILVDDGSTDGSAELCDAYEKVDNRVRVIRQKNKGCIYARLQGLQNSVGTYIGFVDSDDWIEQDMYQTLMLTAEEKNCDIVSMGYTAVYETERKKEDDTVFFGFYEKGRNLDSLISGMMYEENEGRRGVHPALWSKVFKRELLIDAYAKIRNNITMGEDAAIFYPCCLKAERIFIIKGYKYYYRVHDKSMCRTMDINTIFDMFFFYQHMQKNFWGYEKKYNLQKQLKKYLWTFVLPWLKQVFDLQVKGAYLFPYSEVDKDANIILYGAGRVGKAYYTQIEKNHYCNIIAWADKNVNCKGENMISPDRILELDYNKIVIAIGDRKIADEIIDELVGLGIRKEKLLWINPQVLLSDFS